MKNEKCSLCGEGSNFQGEFICTKCYENLSEKEKSKYNFYVKENVWRINFFEGDGIETYLREGIHQLAEQIRKK